MHHRVNVQPPRSDTEACQKVGFDDAVPFVDARLAGGSRVHAVLGTVADPGTCISLRVPASRTFSLADCVASGALTPGGAELLGRVVEHKLAFLVSGGTGSGKTTLLAALLALVPPASASWWWRTPASSRPRTRTWSGWRVVRPTPSSPAP